MSIAINGAAADVRSLQNMQSGNANGANNNQSNNLNANKIGDKQAPTLESIKRPQDYEPKNASEYQKDMMVDKPSTKSLSRMFYYRPAQAAEDAQPLRENLTLSNKNPMSAFDGVSAFSDGENAADGSRALNAVKQRADDAADPAAKCSTCESRTYKDKSDDPGVSFQTAGSIPSSVSGVKAASHEYEHVSRETEKAQREGRVVSSKKITMQMGICPECHKMYMAGGMTHITTQEAGDQNQNAEVMSLFDMMGNPGESFDQDF